jgi:release factor glutamine methyltransferase
MTVRQALAWAVEHLRAYSDTPRLDAEVVLAFTLGWGRARVLAEGAYALAPNQAADFQRLVARRAAREPIAYLVGQREFYGLAFEVSPAVLVPRPETELLVELALGMAQPPTIGQLATIADIGTGSGCIAIALAVHLPGVLVYAIDLSPAALDVAGRNAYRHSVADRVRLLQGDLLAPLPQPVDLIVSNPPYTVIDQIDEGVRRYEPRLALDGGADGLAVYRRLVPGCAGWLNPGGAALFEIGATQANAVAGLARAAFPAAEVAVHTDLAGRDRVVSVRLTG